MAALFFTEIQFRILYRQTDGRGRPSLQKHIRSLQAQKKTREKFSRVFLVTSYSSSSLSSSSSISNSKVSPQFGQSMPPSNSVSSSTQKTVSQLGQVTS